MADEISVRKRLPRSMRLQTKREFTLIHNQGQRLVRGCLIFNWMPLPASSASQVGLITTKKLGNAVVRTRARRLMREAFRLHQHELQQPIALVLVARLSIVGKELKQVERDYLSLMRQARLLKQAE